MTRARCMVLGGLMIPFTALPASIRPFAGLLPSSYAMQALQGLAYDVATPISGLRALAVLGGAGVAALALAVMALAPHAVTAAAAQSGSPSDRELPSARSPRR